MAKYKLWLPALMVGLVLCLTSGPAQAWELSLKGNFDWEMRALGQTGPNGFFGKYDTAANAGAGLTGVGVYAPYNFWAGWNRRAGIVSGSDASWATQYMDTFVDIKINPALQIRGWYRIGEWVNGAHSAATTQAIASGDLGAGDLVASEYLTYRYGGVQRSMSPGYWNYLFMTAQLPWGIVNFGKRRSTFGTGLFYNGEDSRSSETVSVSALYGPLNITLGFYPSRRGTTSASTTSGTGLGGYFNRDRDKNNVRLYDMGPAISYRSGAIDAGFAINYGANYHTGGEGLIDTPANRGGLAAPNVAVVTYLDNHAEFYGTSYLKFNNGRFFFNGEVGWYQIIEKTRGHLPITVIGVGNGGGGFPQIRDLSIDHWRYAAEIGVYSGPAKMSGLFAWLSGGDRRGMGGRIGQIDNTGIIRSTTTSNTGFFRPYSYLINEVYGTGVFQNADTTKGYVEDAIIYAGRLDYAVAANLNASASFMWADRSSKSGFGWGCIYPTISSTVFSNIYTDEIGQISNDNIFRRNNNFNVPNIPDTNLGWEIDGGVDWKLLEGLTVNATVAYWAPGKWFNWACRDKNIANWGTNAPTGTWTVNDPALAFVNPNRTIDPVWGLELKVQGDF